MRLDAKAEGVGILVLPGQPAQEFKTFTCCHCNFPRQMTEKTRHWCDSCNALVCDNPRCLSRCRPWELQMELMENRARFARTVLGR